MTGADITELFNRLGRLVAATKQTSGSGTAWSYTFPDGETHRYVIRGLKSHAEAEDNVFNLIGWIWNTKDYLKRRAKSIGKDPDVVEKAVDADQSLSICADLANRLKHSELRRSRSGRYPSFGKISFTVPRAAIRSLTVRAFEVETDVEDPTLVEFRLPVLDQTGEDIGDAFDYSERALAALERIHESLESKT